MKIDSKMKNKNIYLAGHILNRGAQMQRASERDDLKGLGYDLYVPQDNKSINDKANLSSDDGLAERIVYADTQGIITSDIIVMEAHEDALGTCCELGQIKGMRDVADMILDKVERYSKLQPDVVMCELVEMARQIKEKQVLLHNSDIRRGGNPTETGDRRSYGVHQYVYGLVLDVTDGHGYREWSEIMDILK